jgi:hypothetical protein
MIIVTGTKRSGTSMWMQILIAAGFPPFGEKFPGEWQRTLKDANPSGFYESMLRHGIYYRTNPHPRSGAYFFPEQVERHVVKVFIPGLVRSDRAYIGRVVATMREWREYESSIQRLYAIEDEERQRKHPGAPVPERMPPALEWWGENFSLMRDIAIRRYPVHVQSYDGLLADPPGVITRTLQWLGEGDAAAAIAAVRPENRTQTRPDSTTVEPAVAEVFDELYATVHEARGLSRSFIEKLNRTNEQLVERLRTHQQAVAADAARRRRERGTARDGADPAKSGDDAPDEADEPALDDDAPA